MPLSRCFFLLFPVLAIFACGSTSADDGLEESELARCARSSATPNPCLDPASTEQLLRAVNEASPEALQEVFGISRRNAAYLVSYRRDRRFTTTSDVSYVTGWSCCELRRIVDRGLRTRTCRSDDTLCPTGCNAASDGNCQAVCGDGFQDPGELCDGNCPTQCESHDACTPSVLEGSPETCNAVCKSTVVTSCVSNDGCCPSGCDARTDADCPKTNYVIGSGSNLDSLFVDDDLIVLVNGQEVFRDWGNGAGLIAPISLSAAPGDWVTLRFFDTVGGAKRHGEVWFSGPGTPVQKVGRAFEGGRTDYRPQANQPFHLVVFQIPEAGKAAAEGCLPNEPLDTTSWSKSSLLSVSEATTQRYRARWNGTGANQHGTWPRDYDYAASCQGVISDVFIVGSRWAWVDWNLSTNELATRPVPGHAYNDASARASARHAVNTMFPAGDLSMLTIQP